jgi:hypothetical protein
MNRDEARHFYMTWNELKRTENVPDGMGPGDYLLYMLQGQRVAFYVNVPPSDAKRGGGATAVIAARRREIEQILGHANQFREEPLDIVADYIDTEYLRTRITMRPAGRRMIEDARDGQFDLILLATAGDIGTKEADLEDFRAAISPMLDLGADVVTHLNAGFIE